jgi:hypothetical protein
MDAPRCPRTRESRFLEDPRSKLCEGALNSLGAQRWTVPVLLVTGCEGLVVKPPDFANIGVCPEAC